MQSSINSEWVLTDPISSIIVGRDFPVAWSKVAVSRVGGKVYDPVRNEPRRRHYWLVFEVEDRWEPYLLEHAGAGLGKEAGDSERVREVLGQDVAFAQRHVALLRGVVVVEEV